MYPQWCCYAAARQGNPEGGRHELYGGTQHILQQPQREVQRRGCRSHSRLHAEGSTLRPSSMQLGTTAEGQREGLRPTTGANPQREVGPSEPTQREVARATCERVPQPKSPWKRQRVGLVVGLQGTEPDRERATSQNSLEFKLDWRRASIVVRLQASAASVRVTSREATWNGTAKRAASNKVARLTLGESAPTESYRLQLGAADRLSYGLALRALCGVSPTVLLYSSSPREPRGGRHELYGSTQHIQQPPQRVVHRRGCRRATAD